MRLAGIPLVQEGARVYFSQRSILRTYLLIPAALTFAAIVSWPQGTLENALRAGSTTNPFSVVAVCFVLFLVYLAGRYGGEDYAPDSLGNLREYVTLTPTSVGTLVAGKAAFAVLHTAFLLALGAPFLLAALSVSGSPPGTLGAALGILAAAGLAARMYGLFLLSVLGPRGLLRGAAFLGGTAVYLVLTFLVLPVLNPVSALLALGAGASAHRTALIAGADLCAASTLAAAAGLALSRARRRARRGGPARE